MQSKIMQSKNNGSKQHTSWIAPFARLGWVLGLAFSLLGASSVLAAGDAAAGKDQALPCSACHGQDGATGLDPTYPNLAGQSEKYLFAQLQMIQDSSRSIPLMAGQLNGKSEQDLQDMAAYFASLPAKLGQSDADDKTLAMARAIYKGGILEKGVAACSACHGPTGVGNMLAGYPMISGQSPGYTEVQLKAYREGQRATDDNFGGMMRGVAFGLTDTEIKALATYLYGLH
jgi:cytochrome c553